MALVQMVRNVKIQQAHVLATVDTLGLSVTYVTMNFTEHLMALVLAPPHASQKLMTCQLKAGPVYALQQTNVQWRVDFVKIRLFVHLKVI